MSLRDATQFLEVKERVGRQQVLIEALQAEIAQLKLRLGGLQGQINSLRSGRPPLPEVEGDAARQ